MMSLEIDRGPEIIYRRSGGGRGVRVKGVKGVKGGGKARFCPEYNLPYPPKRLCYILSPPLPFVGKD